MLSFLPNNSLGGASGSPILDSPSGLMSSGIAARAAKIKTAFAAPEPTQKHILHCNSPPRNISTVSGNCSDDLESTQQSHPLSISDRIKMGGVSLFVWTACLVVVSYHTYVQSPDALIDILS